MVLLKIIVCVLIVILTAYIGILKGKKYVDREHILVDIGTFFKKIENEIKYTMSSLPDLFENARQNLSDPVKVCMGAISVDMMDYSEEKPISKSAYDHLDRINALTTYDKDVIVGIIKNLGTTDVEGQVSLIDNGISKLDMQIDEALDSKKKNSKMYQTLGVLTGLTIVILLI